MNLLRIEAMDTVFFRDGKPFSMGEETFAEAQFPPSPSVLYGVLRSVWLANNIQCFDKQKIENKSDESGKLNLRFISLLLKQEQISVSDVSFTPMFPIPNDLIKGKQDKQGNYRAEFLKLKPNEFNASSHNGSHLLFADFDEKTEDLQNKALLPVDALNAYLNSSVTADNILCNMQEMRHLVTTEPKVGLGRKHDTRIAEEGKLYTVNQKRPEAEYKNGISKRLGFLIGYDGMTFAFPATTKIGADGKIAFIEDIKNTNIQIQISKPTIDNKYLKMYLATPAVFNKGWIPELPEGIEIIAAAIGKVQHFGGFDMVKREPKFMLKTVPAGSIYFLKGSTENLQNLIDKYHSKSICFNEINECDYSKEGFGIVYFAKCHPSQISDLKS